MDCRVKPGNDDKVGGGHGWAPAPRNLLLASHTQSPHMTPLPNGWRVHQQKPDRDPEQELGRLKRRFGAITRRFDRADAFRYRRKARAAAFTLLLFAVGLGVPFALMKLLSPWPLMTTIRHLAAAPNCAAARSVGLAPAREGQPGYWSRHDADFDGVACERFVPQS